MAAGIARPFASTACARSDCRTGLVAVALPRSCCLYATYLPKRACCTGCKASHRTLDQYATQLTSRPRLVAGKCPQVGLQDSRWLHTYAAHVLHGEHSAAFSSFLVLPHHEGLQRMRLRCIPHSSVPPTGFAVNSVCFAVDSVELSRLWCYLQSNC